MKKLLFLLPLVFIMVTNSWSQDPSINNKSKLKQVALDGRAFKIKLKSESSSYNDKSSVGNQTQTTTTTTIDQSTGDQNVKTTPDNTRVEVETQTQTQNDKMSQDNNKNEDMKNSNSTVVDMNSFDNKSMVLKFNNGMIHSSYQRTSNLDNCPYTVSNLNTSVQASTSFSATCISNDQSTSSSTINQSKSTTDQSMNTSTTDQTRTTTTSISKVTFVWEGTINGKNINGTLTKKMDDGKMAVYSFSGVETKESDNSKDLGIR